MAKQSALARNHLADPGGDRAAVHALVANSVVAYRQIVGALTDTRSDAAVDGGASAPCLVRHDDGPGRVEYADLGGERIEGGAGVAIRSLHQGFHLLVPGNIPRGSLLIRARAVLCLCR